MKKQKTKYELPQVGVHPLLYAFLMFPSQIFLFHESFWDYPLPFGVYFLVKTVFGTVLW